MKKEAKLTSTTKALRLIRDNDIRRPRRFAELMWPDSPAWKRIHKVGRGSTFGAAMPQAGGAFLGRLRKAGLILPWRDPFALSNEGHERLKAEEAQPEVKE